MSIELPLRVLPDFAAADGSVCAGVDVVLLLPKLQTISIFTTPGTCPEGFKQKFFNWCVVGEDKLGSYTEEKPFSHIARPILYSGL